MFAEIQFTPIRIEAVLADYTIRGELRSRGNIAIFLNDRNYPTFSLFDCELYPLAADRRVETVRQDLITIEKREVIAVSVLDERALENAQLTVSKRKVIVYSGRFAIHGLLHVPADAPDEDVLDEKRDFFGITEGSIYPLAPVGTNPFTSSPLILVNRQTIQAYSVHAS
ncbi:MAG: hypothetical protein WA996_05150 [Candidatus Promineifilaceae bacterium]